MRSYKHKTIVSDTNYEPINENILWNHTPISQLIKVPFNTDDDEEYQMKKRRQTIHWKYVFIISMIISLVLIIPIWQFIYSDDDHMLIISTPIAIEYQQAVVTMATGYHIKDIHPLLASFRAHHPFTQLIIIVKGSLLTNEDRDAFCYYSAQILDLEPIMEYYPSMNAASLRMLASADILTGHTPFNYSILESARQLAYNHTCQIQNEYATWRQFSYYTISNVLRKPLTHAFLCDSRDLIFQSNLMRFLPYDGRFHPKELKPINDGLFVFAESVTIDREYFNKQWINCIQPNFTETLAPNSMVLNSGQVLGSISALLTLLNMMNDSMRRITYCDHLIGIDQGFYNWLIYGPGIPNIRIFIIPHDLGPVLAMHTVTQVRRSPYGAVLNKNNEVYAVLHQYDRWTNYLLPYITTLYGVYSQHCIDRYNVSKQC
jgi:hypothetical protein